jgi:putative PEP-CTERM system histidine kinase
LNPIGSIGFGIAAVAYGGLTVLLLVSWQGRREGGRLIIATAATTLWSVGLLAESANLGVPALVVTLLEALRCATWLAVLVALARSVAPAALLQVTRVAIIGFPAAAVSLLLLAAVGVDTGLDDALLVRGGLVGALLCLVLLEQLYRNATGEGRTAVAPFVLAVGGLFAYDLFLFSQAELLSGFSTAAWDARGYVNPLFVPFLALAARRNPHWSLDIFVSRQAAFFTTTLLATGAYLALMAVGGYAVRALGGSWSGAAQIVFVVGAAAVLVTLLLSATLHRHTRVFLSKHFFRNKYDYRLEWRQFVRTIAAAEGSRALDAAAGAAAQIFGSPRAILLATPFSGGSLAPAARWPNDSSELPQLHLTTQDPLFSFLESTRWIVDLREYRRDREIYQHTPLPGWLQETRDWRLVSPVLEGERVKGVLLLAEPPPPFTLSYEDRDLLEIVGRHIATLLSQAEASARLLEARQFDAYNRLTSFMMHDLKNAAAQLSLVVRNADRHRGNPEFIDDSIRTIAGSAERITRLIEQLRSGADRGTPRPLPLRPLVEAAVHRCSLHSPLPELGELADGLLVRADPERLGTIVDHVIRNAQESTDRSGRVSVSLHLQSGRAVIVVSDDGVGMDADFVRSRLFRPFDSTKGTKGMGIGAYQVREYVRELGGEVEVNSAVGRGTWFAISLPLESAAEARVAVAVQA